MNKLTERQIKRKYEQKRRSKQLKLYKTLIKYFIGLILFFIIAIIMKDFVLSSINTLTNFNRLDDNFKIINTDDYSFQMYEYSNPHENFTSLLIDESLKDFDLDTLDLKYDEKIYFHSDRELTDFYSFVKQDRTKLYILVDVKHKELIDFIENLHDFESIVDVKDKAEIYNCGNPEAKNTIVFVDNSLNIIPKNIAFWNVGIQPDEIRLIENANSFSDYYYDNYIKTDLNPAALDNYNIYVIVNTNNKKLIAACKALEID